MIKAQGRSSPHAGMIKKQSKAIKTANLDFISFPFSRLQRSVRNRRGKINCGREFPIYECIRKRRDRLIGNIKPIRATEVHCRRKGVQTEVRVNVQCMPSTTESRLMPLITGARGAHCGIDRGEAQRNPGNGSSNINMPQRGAGFHFVIKNDSLSPGLRYASPRAMPPSAPPALKKSQVTPVVSAKTMTRTSVCTLRKVPALRPSDQ
jgi:hypothetical protein